jgi:hypothetical protein
MNINKLSSKGICYMCGKPEADSADHIPPKSLFPKDKRKDLITIPAHVDCHHTFSKDDEYFRNSLNFLAFWTSKDARRLWKDKVLPSLKRPQAKGLAQSVIGNIIDIKPVALTDLSGLDVVSSKAIEFDRERINRVVSRIARGLYFKCSGIILQPNSPIECDLNIPELRYERQHEEVKQEFTNVGDDIFRYLGPHTLNDNSQVWFWFVFYDCVNFISIIETASVVSEGGAKHGRDG